MHTCSSVISLTVHTKQYLTNYLVLTVCTKQYLNKCLVLTVRTKQYLSKYLVLIVRTKQYLDKYLVLLLCGSTACLTLLEHPCCCKIRSRYAQPVLHLYNQAEICRTGQPWERVLRSCSWHMGSLQSKAVCSLGKAEPGKQAAITI